jgi:hypothetical protein
MNYQVRPDSRVSEALQGGGTGQRRGEAAGISRAIRVFKRYLKTGDTAPLWVSEGGLEHSSE